MLNRVLRVARGDPVRILMILAFLALVPAGAVRADWEDTVWGMSVETTRKTLRTKLPEALTQRVTTRLQQRMLDL